MQVSDARCRWPDLTRPWLAGFDPSPEADDLGDPDGVPHEHRVGQQRQRDELKRAGCKKVFTDVASGARDRPGRADALTYARKGADELLPLPVEAGADAAGRGAELAESPGETGREQAAPSACGETRSYG